MAERSVLADVVKDSDAVSLFDFWMNLQKDYELVLARQKSLRTIERQVRRRRVAA